MPSHRVVRRRREVGVRVGLGASPRDVTRLLASFLPGVSSLDPLAFAGTATLMTLAAALASFVPARRAARLDPLLALRE